MEQEAETDNVRAKLTIVTEAEPAHEPIAAHVQQHAAAFGRQPDAHVGAFVNRPASGDVSSSTAVDSRVVAQRNPFPFVDGGGDASLRRSMREVLEGVFAVASEQEAFAIFCKPYDNHFFVVFGRYVCTTDDTLQWILSGKIDGTPIRQLDERCVRRGSEGRHLVVAMDGRQKIYLPRDLARTLHGNVQGQRNSRHEGETVSVRATLFCYAVLPGEHLLNCWLNERGTGDLLRWSHKLTLPTDSVVD